MLRSQLGAAGECLAAEQDHCVNNLKITPRALFEVLMDSGSFTQDDL